MALQLRGNSEEAASGAIVSARGLQNSNIAGAGGLMKLPYDGNSSSRWIDGVAVR